MAEYLYVLKLVPRLQDENNWRPEDGAAVERHFAYLQDLLAQGRLILAGRTQVAAAETFGLVIFRAENEEDARAVMDGDPSIIEGVMTASLYPYQVALKD